MRTMSTCHHYSAVCPARGGKGLHQCDTQAPIRQLPSTHQVHDAVLRMCEMMPGMDDCQQCSVANCPDPLRTLGTICQDMWMDGCEVLSNACSAVRQSAATRPMAEGGDAKALAVEMSCPSSHHPQAPVMKMYFHFGFNDYVLFKNIVPTDGTQYTLCVVAILAAGVLSALLRGYKISKEVYWSENAIVRVGMAVTDAGVRPTRTAADRTSSVSRYVASFIVYVCIVGWMVSDCIQFHFGVNYHTHLLSLTWPA
jgi:hypothetical protein